VIRFPALPALRVRALASALSLAIAAAGAHAQPASTTAASSQGFDIPLGKDAVRVELAAADIVHVAFRPLGKTQPSSIVIDPALRATTIADVHLAQDEAGVQLDTPQLHVSWNRQRHELTIADATRQVLLRTRDLAALAHGRLAIDHASGQPLYGVAGYDATERVAAGLLRTGPQRATAGEQGHAGAPFVWSTAGYGLLLDAVGARFSLGDTRIDARMAPAHPDYYVFVGKPAAIFGALAKVSGPTPLFPKWAMGFTNSQWGIDQRELLDIVDTYRAKHIPIDNITLDFDWKAWGEDDGEFRWNPRNFPDGPNGKLKQQLDARGIHLTGIMKPRVHLDTTEGREAAARGYFIAGNRPAKDYFSGKTIRELDFANPAARAWFFSDALKQSFRSGIVGWWNDEADNVGIDTQHMDMQRALYDGQRGISDLRVWSINRNFYLGAQRYAYGLWSGDIHTGFASMAGQRARMLSAIDVGAMQWGMDGGGFKVGRPSPENYARWIEFGAFTPIFRVHGERGEKRQPWVYGPIAEQAATDAIRLRYTLIPYIYSYEQQRRRSGVGLVRPLTFDWPDDPKLRNAIDAWMFGDSLLVSPVVEQGQTSKDVYLPAGHWTDWFSGKVISGGQTLHIAVDSTHWHDIPLYIRQGAIIPMQPAMDYVGQRPLTQLDVAIFPDDRRTTFDYYDDDGSTYAYEHGVSFSQTLTVQRKGDTVRGDTVRVDIGAASGSFRPALKFYLLKIHGIAATAVSGLAPSTAFADLVALANSAGEGWSRGHDRYGEVTYVRVAAAAARQLELHATP
jgi:alpha-glucosidase (family GH31 glycosyl hydrolase)